MGGFEGGDEGGFWDGDTFPSKKNKNKSKHKGTSYIETSDSSYSIKAHTKVNNLFSQELYDIISFVPCKCETFSIEGCDDIPLESNSIYKAYKAFKDLEVVDFFCEHKVVVIKRIAIGEGLRGASSNAAAFMCLSKEVCSLLLTTDALAKLGSSIASDVPDFIYNYSTAKVD